MYLNKYLKDNSVFIIPDNFKKVMIEAINAQPLLNIKIITISQLKKKMLFQYDEKTILYLIKNKNISFLNAIEELESLYFLNNKISNNKFKYLSNLKNTLDEHKLLYYDKHFLNSLAKKKVYIIDFNNLSKLELYLIDILKTKTNLEFINMPLKNNLQPNILNFQNINEEIEYLANDIAKKINNGINVNNIFLANYNDDYRSTIKRVFDFYNIPINLDNNISLYDTKVGLNLLNNLNNTTNILNEIKNDNIYDSCLNILNKYYWIKDFNTIKKVLIEEFKIKKLKNKKYKDAVNLIDLKDNLVPSDSHVYLIGFNDEYIPKVFKDDDYIVDIEKNELLETTKEKNSNERKNWIKILNNTPNLTITFADMSLKGSMHPSSLLESFHFNKINYRASHYSNCSNKYNLALLYDDYTKFGAIHTELPKLKFNYRNLNYLTYNNNYTQINQNLIKDNFKKGLYLSYTKL
ncbi:MAG: hypothetical protein PHF21_02255, partial [Bacilli bacterium]|nr:hypothetical protein [Bacilli bacterium]